LTFTFAGKNKEKKFKILFFPENRFELNGIVFKIIEDIKGHVVEALYVKRPSATCITVR